MPRELDLLTIIATRKPDSWVLVGTFNLTTEIQMMQVIHAGCCEKHAKRMIGTPRFYHLPWWHPMRVLTLGDDCLHCGERRQDQWS